MREKSEIKKCPDCGGSGKVCIDQALLIYLFIKENSSDKPVDSKKIESKFKLSPPTVKRIINRIQSEYYPVVANKKGYFIASSAEDLESYKNNILSRIESLFKKLWNIEGLQIRLAEGKTPPEIPLCKCKKCSGLGRVMVNTRVYDDLIIVGGSSSGIGSDG